MTITGLGIKTDICVEFGISTVIVGIRVGGGWRYRGFWIVLKAGHTGHITEQTIFIVGLGICYFGVFLEGSKF